MQEGKLTFYTTSEKIIEKSPAFYNPIMKSNRDITIEVLKIIDKERMQIADPLCATGIRSMRILKELPAKKIKKVYANDHSEKAIKFFKKALKENKINEKKIELFNQDANKFLLERKGFDYIDIDPYGSPNPFLDNAIKRLARTGILAITATDTSSLAGTFENACKRKYWAKPLRNELKHEIGLRILIRKVQLIGGQYERALIPILSYSKDHYLRIFFLNEKGKKKVDIILKQHKNFYFNHKTKEFGLETRKRFNEYGPIWTGKLQDKKILKKIKNEFVQKLYKEKDLLGFYDIHSLASLKKKTVPKFDKLLQKLKGTKTHFSPYGIKTKATLKEIMKLIQ